MEDFNSDFMRTLAARGYLHQATEARLIDGHCVLQMMPGYVGFDATAPSLHVGNLVSIMLLRRLQQTGHRPIVLMGGGTSKIGDPSGKDETRRMLTAEQIADNVAAIRRIFERFLSFDDSETGAILVDNSEWLDKLGWIEMLREVGQHFTINRMLTMESVKLRLDREQPMTFLEFNYMVSQAYDFMELHRRYGCRMQMGGSDQWGNIVNGVELTRRVDGAHVFGITTPLITRADGQKMGKSVSGAIWLHEDQLPHWDYWQFWRNVDDRDVGRFLKLFTDVPLDEIARIEALQGSEINDAKILLANEATKLARGLAAARAADETAKETFGEGGRGVDLPRLEVSVDSMLLIDALAEFGFVSSRGEAKRLIKAGGARIDGEPARDEAAVVAIGAEPVKISAGKKTHGLLVRA
jgi:tyrosyl-tRNA synthetase